MDEMDPETRRQYLAEFDAQHRRATMHFLSKMSQTSSVADLQAEFEDLMHGVTGLFEPLVISYFISALRPEIQREMFRFRRPSTLVETFLLARSREASVEVTISDSLFSSPKTIPGISIPGLPSLTTTPPPPQQHPLPPLQPVNPSQPSPNHSTSLGGPMKSIHTPIVSSDSLPPILVSSTPSPELFPLPKPLPDPPLSHQTHNPSFPISLPFLPSALHVPPLTLSSLGDQHSCLLLSRLPPPEPPDSPEPPESPSNPPLFPNPSPDPSPEEPDQRRAYPSQGTVISKLDGVEAIAKEEVLRPVVAMSVTPMKKAEEVLHTVQPQLALFGETGKNDTEDDDAEKNLQKAYDGRQAQGGGPVFHLSRSLESFYSKCGDMSDAQQVFDKIPDKDLVTRNSMFDGYVKCGKIGCARQMFDEMLNKDLFSWTSLANGYSRCGKVEAARELFDQMLEKNVGTWNSMITGYEKVGLLKQASEVLFGNQLPEKTIVGWNTVTAEYALYGASKKALELYSQVQSAHRGLIQNGFGLDILVAAAVSDFYCKMGRIIDAIHVGEMPHDNIMFLCIQRTCIHFNHWIERKDVMSNVSIYKAQASALKEQGAANCNVSIVANAANNFKGMTMQVMESDVVTNNMLLSIWVRAMKLDYARKVLDEFVLSHGDSVHEIEECKSYRTGKNIDMGKILGSSGAVPSSHPSVSEGDCKEYCCITLDSGKKFIVQDVGEDGLLSMLEEVGSDKKMTLQEFEVFLSLSNSVQQFSEQEPAVTEEKQDNCADMKKIRPRNWWRSFIWKSHVMGISYGYNIFINEKQLSDVTYNFDGNFSSNEQQQWAIIVAAYSKQGTKLLDFEILSGKVYDGGGFQDLKGGVLLVINSTISVIDETNVSNAAAALMTGLATNTIQPLEDAHDHIGHAIESFSQRHTGIHGVSAEAMEKLKIDLEESFEFPLKEKEAFASLPGGLQGYGQKLVLNEEKLGGQDMMSLFPQLFHSKNFTIWPTSPPIFRSTLNNYPTKHESVPQCLCDAIAKDFSLYPELLCGIVTDHQIMRMSYYPPCLKANQVLDINLLSLRADTENWFRGIYAYGFAKSFAVQRKGMVFLIKGPAVIQQTQVGTTGIATFCYGTLQQFNCRSGECQTLVLNPTSEEAQQFEKSMQPIGDYLGLKVHAWVGGTSGHENQRILSARFLVVEVIPDCVFDMLRKHSLGPDHTNGFVLSETDEDHEMLPGGFKDQNYDILQPLSSTYQDGVFHPTRPPDTLEITLNFVNKPMRKLFSIQCFYNVTNEELLHCVALEDLVVIDITQQVVPEPTP